MKHTASAANKQLQAASGKKWEELYLILNNLLQRRHYLLPFVKEFRFIDNALNQYLQGGESFCVGDFKINFYPAPAYCA
ncbi:MAG: hypothetical protein LBR90_04505, partial [Elusimicrobiota bacterium]|nr:hypothetical protein [Elusimicrobiota bacterium]